MKPTILILLAALAVSGCNNQEDKRSKEVSTYDSDTYSIVEIDSCEYVVFRESYKGGICHKGNCKFCEQRHHQIARP